MEELKVIKISDYILLFDFSKERIVKVCSGNYYSLYLKIGMLLKMPKPLISEMVDLVFVWRTIFTIFKIS